MRKGFTLLEILVVMGIIAILLSVGIVSYSTIQKTARDAKRKEDLKSIQSALEQYYSNCGNIYPVAQSGTVGSSIVCLSPTFAILPTVPVDPKSGTGYSYSVNGNDYSICAPNDPPLEAQSDATYCLNNQQ